MTEPGRIEWIHRSAWVLADQPPRLAQAFDRRFPLGYAPYRDARDLFHPSVGGDARATLLPQRLFAALIDDVSWGAPDSIRRLLYDSPHRAMRMWCAALTRGEIGAWNPRLATAPPSARRLIRAAAWYVAGASEAVRLPPPDGVEIMVQTGWIVLRFVGVARIMATEGTCLVQHRRDLSRSVIETLRWSLRRYRSAATDQKRASIGGGGGRDGGAERKTADA